MKRILIILILLLNAEAIYAQQYSAKNLLGRWESVRNKEINLVFFTDSTGAFLSADGFLKNKIKYNTELNKDMIKLKLTLQVDKKNPGYEKFYFKFINDSVLISSLGKAIPKNVDTSDRKIQVYKKIRHELPGTEMRMHNFKDLQGFWKHSFKDTLNTWKLNFVDDSTVYKKEGRKPSMKLKYIADFTTQPMTMNFYNDKELVDEALFYFYNKNIMSMQYSESNKKQDHFKSLLFGVKALIPYQRQATTKN